MFDIGWSEMAVILLVALVVIGPRDLPRVARTMGRWVAKGRGMAREFQTALEDMAREAELDKVKQEIEKAARTDLGKTVEHTLDPTGELGKAFDPTTIGKPSPAKAAASPKIPADQATVAAPMPTPAPAVAVAAQPAAPAPAPDARVPVAAKPPAPTPVGAKPVEPEPAAVEPAAPQPVAQPVPPQPAAQPVAPQPVAPAPDASVAAGRARATVPEAREPVPADPS